MKKIFHIRTFRTFSLGILHREVKKNNTNVHGVGYLYSDGTELSHVFLEGRHSVMETYLLVEWEKKVSVTWKTRYVFTHTFFSPINIFKFSIPGTVFLSTFYYCQKIIDCFLQFQAHTHNATTHSFKFFLLLLFIWCCNGFSSSRSSS